MPIKKVFNQYRIMKRLQNLAFLIKTKLNTDLKHLNTKALISGAIFFLTMSSLSGEETGLGFVHEKIWNEIYSENYANSEKLTLGELEKSPENLKLLSLLEISLNGQGRKKEAQVTRKKIFEIWKRKYKSAFIKENYPLNLATYPRMVEVKPSSLLIGSEFYMPYPVNKEKTGYYYNKIVVYNRFTKKPAKFFKLEKSDSSSGVYILYEIEQDGNSKKIKEYSTRLPSLRDEMEEVVKFLGL